MQNQVLIDYKYCVENPKHWKGYGPNYWGLTAGYSRNKDGSVGYDAHFPQNDHGGNYFNSGFEQFSVHAQRI
ncbi:glucoamylase family protein [Chryseobacterium indoltheticum]|uniref:glucoamylase family protein n=1 Tax=Chryseobacterium indoltheticum TaxID=254 RepID=UPI003F497AA2